MRPDLFSLFPVEVMSRAYPFGSNSQTLWDCLFWWFAGDLIWRVNRYDYQLAFYILMFRFQFLSFLTIHQRNSMEEVECFRSTFMLGWILLAVLLNAINLSSESVIIPKISSINLMNSICLVSLISNSFDSNYPIYVLAKFLPSLLLIAVPSICLYFLSLKLKILLSNTVFIICKVALVLIVLLLLCYKAISISQALRPSFLGILGYKDFTSTVNSVKFWGKLFLHSSNLFS